ncbi:putative rhamnosyl transferase [Aestuariivita sp.]|jgi:hypothetical protein|uniref:putative rhamnosyl transferase n=1 Tax=Aestuariivita sp. TaxID=1872407 RepID=UPI00216D79A8|nr:putative rhamnosyl transferase [Aestuariivita sp.]MCE8007035.1 hypothetical protein [Aestuariivita sp.]
MQVIGLCRFSYPGHGGFQIEHETMAQRIDYLYGDARLSARFAQFEAITLPGIKAQTDPDFTFVVVIGDSLPARWRTRLEALLADIPQAQIQTHAPGPHRQVMQAAINAAKADPEAPCLQFRHDDDDAVAIDFVERLRAAAAENADLVAKNRLVAFDFTHGYSISPGPDGIEVAPSVLTLYGVALAMAVRGGAKQTIMNFAHKKLGQFMPVVSYADTRMFLRGHSDHNDSRQKAGVAPLETAPLDEQTAELIWERFRIDEATVRRVFSRI